MACPCRGRQAGWADSNACTRARPQATGMHRHARANMCAQACTHTRACAHTQACTHVHPHTRPPGSPPALAHARTHVRAHKYRHARTHAQTYRHARTRTRARAHTQLKHSCNHEPTPSTHTCTHTCMHTVDYCPSEPGRCSSSSSCTCPSSTPNKIPLMNTEGEPCYACRGSRGRQAGERAGGRANGWAGRLVDCLLAGGLAGRSKAGWKKVMNRLADGCVR